MAGYDFSNFNQNDNITTFEQEDAMVAGQDIKLVFEMPDGNKLTSTFKSGQDWAWAKHFISQETGVDSNDINLFFNGKSIPDILSFADIAGIQNDSVVKVQIGDGK